MQSNIKNIMRERITIINISQKEAFRKIIKSIYQNNNISNFIKIYANYQYNKSRSKNSFLSKKHKICLYTGKRSGVVSGFSFSRYTIKKLLLTNKLTNVKKNNW